MKTKKIFQLGFLLIAVLTFVAAGCKKDSTSNGKNSDTASLQQLTKDENNVTKISDDASNDANAVLSGATLKMVGPWLCNVTVDSTATANDTIVYYLTYNGLNCNGNIFRTGKQEVRKRVGTVWGQPGTVVLTKLINFHITHVYSGKSMTLNGTRTHENVSGGFIWQLGNGVTSVVHKITGSMQATFDDGSTRTWMIARQHVYTGTLTQLVMTTDGFGSADGYNNLATWGLNRNGEQFYSQITQSIVHKQACDWNPVAGTIIHQVPSDNKTATVSYGYDDNNLPVTGDNCPTRYRIDWVKNGNSGTIFLQLP